MAGRRPVQPSSSSLNQIGRFLRDGVSHSLEMRARDQGKYTGIHDPQILRPIDQQVRIDNTTVLTRHHGRGAAGVEHSFHAAFDP